MGRTVVLSCKMNLWVNGVLDLHKRIKRVPVILFCLHNPHFLIAGEEGGGFEAYELCGAPCLCAVDFLAVLVQGSFDIRLFPQAHVLFGQDLTGIVPVFLDWRFE